MDTIIGIFILKFSTLLSTVISSKIIVQRAVLCMELSEIIKFFTMQHFKISNIAEIDDAVKPHSKNTNASKYSTL